MNASIDKGRLLKCAKCGEQIFATYDSDERRKAFMLKWGYSEHSTLCPKCVSPRERCDMAGESPFVEACDMGMLRPIKWRIHLPYCGKNGKYFTRSSYHSKEAAETALARLML